MSLPIKHNSLRRALTKTLPRAELRFSIVALGQLRAALHAGHRFSLNELFGDVGKRIRMGSRKT